MELNGKIKYDDNFLTPEEFVQVHEYCKSAEYRYGEADDYGLGHLWILVCRHAYIRCQPGVSSVLRALYHRPVNCVYMFFRQKP